MRKEKKKRVVTYSVTPSHLRYKKAHLGPTLFQQQLLDYLRTRKTVPFEETVGYNWTMLGGLLARGVVTWDSKDGEQMLVFRRKS